MAFSSESKLLKLAGTSSNVIEVHALPHQEKKEKRKTVISRLVLKKSDPGKNDRQVLDFYSGRAPNLLISSH